MLLGYELTTWIIPLLLCMIVHEVEHGLVAERLGDDTARRAGRLTMNPVVHIDPLGSIVLPAMLWAMQASFLFGWAKPVPVDFGRLNRPKRDMGLVAAAGPVSNLLLAMALAIVGRVCMEVFPEGQVRLWLMQNIINGIQLSLVIGIFNLLPILPLDGGRILVAILPLKYAIRLQETEKYGFLILFGVILLSQISGLNVIGWFIGALYPFFAKIVSLLL